MGSLGEEREAVASAAAVLGSGSDAAQLSGRSWIFLVLIPQGFYHQPRDQAAASPSLTGMLMWALSRGALWPSRSTSTYGEGTHGSRGVPLTAPAPCKGHTRPGRHWP